MLIRELAVLALTWLPEILRIYLDDKRALIRGELNIRSLFKYRNIEPDQGIYNSDDVRCHDCY